MYSLCYIDEAVSGEHSLPGGAWKTADLNYWDNGLWILGKENNFHSGTSSSWKRGPGISTPREHSKLDWTDP